jgi:hypothetical protein
MPMLQESDNGRSHIIFLLEQQKYEEALPILSDLIEKNPSHREYLTYRLLVLRILVLHWNLSRATTGSVNYLCGIKERIASKVALIRHISEGLRNRPVGQIFDAAHRSWTKLNLKCGGRISGVGCAVIIALLSFHLNGVSKVQNFVPSNMLAVADGGQLAISGSKAYHPNETEIANRDHGETQFREEVYGGNLRETSGRSELLPREMSMGTVAVVDHLHRAVEQESGISERHVTTEPPRINTSRVFAKRQERAAGLNIESSKEPTINEHKGEKEPRPIVAHHQVQVAVPIRKSPRFAAPTVQEIESGIVLNVLESIGSWAKVELAPGGVTGFVRREFLIAINNTDSEATPGSIDSEGGL